MKQIAQNYKSGELTVLDVPLPTCRPGGVLVRTYFSLISTGTELMKVSEARMSLIGKARARPDQVRKVLESASQQGVAAAYKKAMSRLDSLTPLGYSLCGTVVEVGDGVSGLEVGQLVAAAGNEFALHAELNWVPTNLCVAVPEGVDPRHAAFATVGAIAMQGVRRGEPSLGEVAVVIGLGLVGQLMVRLLVANGVTVVGFDTVDERCRLAEGAGALMCAAPDDDGIGVIERVIARASGGLGADHVFLAAGGSSNGPVELAARVARDRARVVDVGKTSLDLPWNAYYEKELDVRFSRSYGPGRYDDRYELDGIDYPAGYVRWTERRNLSCFLDLLSAGAVKIDDLVTSVHEIDTAPAVYDQLREGTLRGVGVLLSYPGPGPLAPVVRSESQARVPRRATAGGAVRIGFIGAGNYASSMLLPHLVKDPAAELVTVVTSRSLTAANSQQKFGFRSASTDADSVLLDPAIDAVFIATRHHAHCRFVIAALEAGKVVFVEKPLALSEEEVQSIEDAVVRTGNDRLMVGFNRRFAPLFGALRMRRGSATSPWSVRYLVNAGQVGAGSWYADELAEGTRFVGEGGHFIDAVSAWVGSNPSEVTAFRTSDRATIDAHLLFSNGSSAVITYGTAGSSRAPKELFDAMGDGRTFRLENFVKASSWGPAGKDSKRSLTGPDKGQRVQVSAFVESVRSGGPMPIALDSLIATTRATLAVEESIRSGATVKL